MLTNVSLLSTVPTQNTRRYSKLVFIAETNTEKEFLDHLAGFFNYLIPLANSKSLHQAIAKC